MDKLVGYYFKGTIPASKSLMNRALICSSYGAGLQLLGSSSCDDVLKMQIAIEQLKKYQPSYTTAGIFDAGAAGTVFRFLSLRLSRIPGRHILKGTRRLMQRPQQDLLDVFARLGVEYKVEPEHLEINSRGWQNLEQPIEVKRGVSSQFASGLILNAWDLEKDLVLNMSGDPISEGYLEMTIQVVKKLGMQIEGRGQDYIIHSRSAVKGAQYLVESDLSSVFAVAAFAVLNGQAYFENFPEASLQPDVEFVKILERMEIPVELVNGTLKVGPVSNFKGVEVNLGSCPDLFPVLATLCAFADTPSRLFGAPQLVHKESDRISKISELLTQLGVRHEKTSEGMLIHPNKIQANEVTEFKYDTDHDHRLAFSAALIKSRGFPIQILNPDVVSKSFPEFWQVVGLETE